ncbi:unnamed protein product [Ambrosiozyma monospora]|uniref:Unnamed protein product n=1 Tax=Ambrosiozyma monospora TaxID=43982 RepID=A0A9W6WE58_AMBMO|nr:unnamed protein product [Ambrosiozyma monospora]
MSWQIFEFNEQQQSKGNRINHLDLLGFGSCWIDSCWIESKSNPISLEGRYIATLYDCDIDQKPYCRKHLESGKKQVELLAKAGIEHMDIADRNLFVRENGEFVLFDYNVVKLSDSAVSPSLMLHELYRRIGSCCSQGSYRFRF